MTHLQFNTLNDTLLSRSTLITILLVIMVAALLPTTAYAIDFPTITGISATDDPITIGIKIAALILKSILYIIFVSSFAVAAYVAITTLLKMVKDRENAGDLVGKLMASLFVVVISYWFLSEGEKAADELKDIKLSQIEIIHTPESIVES